MNPDEANVPVNEQVVADNVTTETEQIEIPTFDLIPDVKITTVAPAQDEAPVVEEKPDEWFQVPQQFEDGKELDWYKERFNTVMQSIKPSKEYLDSILNSICFKMGCGTRFCNFSILNTLDPDTTKASSGVAGYSCLNLSCPPSAIFNLLQYN